MKKLPIADCRLPIKKLFAGRGFSRGGHDGGKRIGFLKQGGQLALGHRARLDQQFEPQRSFVGFFVNGSDFGDEFGLAAGAATSAIVRRHGRAATYDLFGNSSSCLVTFWNRPRQFNDSQGKGFGSYFEFGWIHATKLQIQSAIGNRQSAIQR